MKLIETPIIPISQPIGNFYIGKVNASSLRDAVDIKRKSENPNGVQRELINNRLNEIRDYCNDTDATFPTSIILSIDTSREGVKCEISENRLRLEFKDHFGSVIDGQHRLKGILASDKAELFELPVVFMVDPTTEDEAYIFSIINSTQRKVDPSLIYDLFDVIKTRSPKKTVHDIARALNGREDSPFYNRLKMLGRKTDSQIDATLSQGTFGKRVLRLISRDPEGDARRIKNGEELLQDNRCIFRSYFINNSDDVILKILLNCFNALKTVFPEEWKSPKYSILWKSTGFNAVIDSLPEIYNYGLKRKRLTEGLFVEIFKELREKLIKESMTLTSVHFGSGESETKRLKKLICDSIPKTGKSFAV